MAPIPKFLHFLLPNLTTVISEQVDNENKTMFVIEVPIFMYMDFFYLKDHFKTVVSFDSNFNSLSSIVKSLSFFKISCINVLGVIHE